MGHRTSKADAMLSTMKHKGITSVGLTNKAAVRILYATIIPSLIYGMESFYMTENNYLQLDTFAADALKYKPTETESENPIWNLFESDMVPPSLLIKIAKLKLKHKILHLPKEHLLAKLQDGKPSRLFQETKAIMKQWKSIEVLSEALGQEKKSTMKLHMKVLKDDIITNAYLRSMKGSYLNEAPHRIPKRLTFGMKQTLLIQRKRYVTSPVHKGQCPVCKGEVQNSIYIHYHLECKNLPRQLREENLWSTIDTHDGELTCHLKSLPMQELMEYLLGFNQFDDKEMTLVVLRATHTFVS